MEEPAHPEHPSTWTGNARSRIMALGGAIGVLVGAFFLTVGIFFVALPCLVVALMLSSFSTIAVTVDASGVRIAFGPWGFPTKQIALNDIESAQAIDVRPLRWGGWGYRWMPWKRASAVVLRKGPGLKLDRVDGRTLVVTVDGASRAAAVLNDLRRA